MSNSQSTHLNVEAESDHHGENNNLVPSNGVPHTDPNGVLVNDPIDANSHIAINAHLPTDSENSVRGGHRLIVRETPEDEGDGISLWLIFKMLQGNSSSINVPYQTLNTMANHIVPTMLPDTEIHKVALQEGIS